MSGPVMARTRCGIISPMKTIGPHAAVAAPHSSVTASIARTRVRVRWAPRDRAVSSPISRALSGRAMSRVSSTPSAMNGHTLPTVSMFAEANEPTVQNRSRSSAAEFSSCTALT